jgi:Xaa-Pro aminopeptidase
LAGLTLADKEWRYARIRKFIREHELDAILLSGNAWEECNIRYVTGQYFRIGQRYGYALFPADGEPEIFAFHPTRAYQYRCVDEFKDDIWFDRAHIHQPTFETIAKVMRAKGLEKGRLGIDRSLLDTVKFEALRQEFPDLELPDIAAGFTELRRVKSPGELSLARQSARVCDEIWLAMRDFIRPGIYDYQITAEWSRIMYEHQADKVFNLMQINSLDVSCPYWTSAHSPVRVEEGSMILMEITAAIGGYWTQRVALASVGEPQPIMRELHKAAAAAQVKGAEAIKPGVNAKDICHIMDEEIRAAGWLSAADFEAGPRGHLMGLTIDEGTFSAEEDLILKENMVLVLHPSAAGPGFQLKKPGVFGPGNMYAVTADGCEKLYGPEIELMIL